MKNRYIILIIFILVTLLILLYTSKSFTPKPNNNVEGLANENANAIIIPDQDEEATVHYPKKTTKQTTKIMPNTNSTTTKTNDTTTKESFLNFSSLSEGYTNSLNMSVCSKCNQSDNQSPWNCDQCTPPPKYGQWTSNYNTSSSSGNNYGSSSSGSGNNYGSSSSYGTGTNNLSSIGNCMSGGIMSNYGTNMSERNVPGYGSSSSSSDGTESFDNMSSNFNNIMFSNPTSTDQMLDYFKNIMFSTDCCPSSYSTDQGCACISPCQYNILRTRANNNIPYSEF